MSRQNYKPQTAPFSIGLTSLVLAFVIAAGTVFAQGTFIKGGTTMKIEPGTTYYESGNVNLDATGSPSTLTNNGSAGSVLTAAVINQPQVAIISTDAIVRRPVVVDLPDGSEGIAIHAVGNLAMSWDHRAFDGAYAAGFLKKVKAILETRDWDAEL